MEGYHEVLYPVQISRQSHWDSVSPDVGVPCPIRLPEEGKLQPGDIYVPAGWFWSGGDPEASSLAGQRLWMDGFVIRQLQITNRQYITFLNSLMEEGKAEEALRCVPRESPGTGGKLGAMIYGQRSDGRFHLRPDAEGDIWDMEYPVCMVDWNSARSYASWVARCHSQPWRLPVELEWEKAARGVDGRFYPWGDYFDASWCCVRSSHSGRPLPQIVGSSAVDRSPYGVQDMAGNMSDWTMSMFTSEGPPIEEGFILRDKEILISEEEVLKVYRGGGWSSLARYARLAERARSSVTSRGGNVGFRIARSFH